MKHLKSEEFYEHVKKTIEEHESEKLPEKEDDPVVTEDEISFWEKIFKSKGK